MKPDPVSKIIPVLLPLIFLFSACREHNVYHEFKTLAHWNRTEVLYFEDSLDLVSGRATFLEVSVQLRNDNSYPYTNLCLNADIILPDTTYQECITINLVKENGKWAGSGWGSLFTQEVVLTKLPVVNTFKIELSHAMQDEVLEGIRNVGICLRAE